MVGFSAPPGGLKKRDDYNEEKKSLKLTDAMLDNVIKDDFQHDQMTVQTDSEKAVAQERAIELKKIEIQERKKREEQERLEREAEEAEEAEQSGEGDEHKGDDENNDDLSDIEYEIYYDQTNIKRTLKEQRKDLFKELMNDRKFIYSKHKGIEQLKATTKYKIENYAPKMDQDDDSPQKKGKR